MYSVTMICLGLLLLLCVVGLSGSSVLGDVEPNQTCRRETPKQKVNSAFLTIEVMDEDILGQGLVLWTQTEECYTCPLKNVSAIQEATCTALVDTRWKMRVAITADVSSGPDKLGLVNCTEPYLSHHFSDAGNYTIYIRKRNNTVECSKPYPLNDVTDVNIPVYVAIGVFAALAILYIACKRFWYSRTAYRIFYKIKAGPDGTLDPNLSADRDLGRTNSNGSRDEAPVEVRNPAPQRLKSLDTFRGISIVVMIFVNYGGGHYWYFNHSIWNGLTVADLVFPWFVFIMGTAMAYSFRSQLRKGAQKPSMFLKIIKRTLILYAFGLIINGTDSPVVMEHFRVIGVLQRFAFTYGISASIHLVFVKVSDSRQYGRRAWFRDILDYWPELCIYLIFVTLHLILTFCLPVPHCPTGYLGPGGVANDSGGHKVQLCTGGAAGYIDRQVLTPSHIFQSPTSASIYDTSMPYDPEGLLGTLTSCFMCFLGLQAGKILLIYHDYKERTGRMIIWGVCLGCLALLLCKASRNDGWIPINKNLWSLSFVLALAGMAFILLTFCYLTIDVYNVWSGAPFFYPGMNSILLYMGHEIFSGRFPVAWEVPDTHASLLALNLWGTTFWVLVATFLYYKRFFLAI